MKTETSVQTNNTLPELSKLSDGRAFTFRVGLTKDLRKAHKAAGKQPDDILYHLVADCCQIEGEQLYFEDILELPIGDFNTLLQAVQGEAGEQ